MADHIGNLVGLGYIQLSGMDTTNNRATGTAADPDTIANDTTLHALLLKGATSVDAADPTRTQIVFQGNDGVIGSIFLGAADLPEGTLVDSTMNTTLWRMAVGGNASTTHGGTIFSSNPKNLTLKNLYMLVSRIWQSRDSGSDGTTQWLTTCHRIQLIPRFPAASFQEATSVEYQISPQSSTQYPGGLAFAAGTEGWSETYVWAYLGSYPIGMTTYIAAGGATVVFTVGYLPKSSTITSGNFPNFFQVQSVKTALSSISTTTGVATMAAAGSAADHNVLMYETEFGAI